MTWKYMQFFSVIHRDKIIEIWSLKVESLISVMEIYQDYGWSYSALVINSMENEIDID